MKSNLILKLATIQAEMKAKKSRYNGFGKYYYRAAEDILEAVKPFCIKNSESRNAFSNVRLSGAICFATRPARFSSLS